MIARWRSFLHDDRGAATVEYASVLALFAIIAVIAMVAIATSANTNYNNGTTALTNVELSPP